MADLPQRPHKIGFVPNKERLTTRPNQTQKMDSIYDTKSDYEPQSVVHKMVRLCHTLRRSTSSSNMLMSPRGSGRQGGLSSTQASPSTANATFETHGKRRMLKSQNPFLNDLFKKAPAANGSCSPTTTTSNVVRPSEACELVSPVFESLDDTNRKTPFDLDFLDDSFPDLGCTSSRRQRQPRATVLLGGSRVASEENLSVSETPKEFIRRTATDPDLFNASLPDLRFSPSTAGRKRHPQKSRSQRHVIPSSEEGHPPLGRRRRPQKSQSERRLMTCE